MVAIELAERLGEDRAMLSRLRVIDLGPHEDFAFVASETGTTAISGPSQCGKTTLIDALAFVLWGTGPDGRRFDSSRIRDGAKRARVELRLADGAELVREIDRSRAMTRWIDGRTVGKEVDWRRAVGLAADPAVGRLILAPMSWKALASGNARPLRDALASALGVDDPGPLIQAQLARLGYSLGPGEEGVDDRKATGLRREARKLAAFEAGRHEAASGQLARLRDRLGDPPAPRGPADAGLHPGQPVTPEPNGPARGTGAPPQLDVARDQLAEARLRWKILHRQCREAATHLQELQSTPGCPQCGSRAWPKRVDAIGRAALELKDLDQQLRLAEAAGREATETLRRVVSASPPASGSTRLADSRRRALGEEIAILEAELEAAGARVAASEAEAARLDALVGAVRDVPSRLLRDRLPALGDLDPITLVVGSAPAVSVLVDGRAEYLASRGRSVVADAILRDAIRRVAGSPLPLIVDNVQDVGGQPLPEIAGPVWLLRTTGDETLNVDTT